MKTVEMKVLRTRGTRNKSRIYSKKVRLKGLQNSAAVELPNPPVIDIAVQQTGNAIIYLTNYSYREIEADTAEWVLYDGESKINNAITAIKFENTIGSTKIMITTTRGI